MEVSGVIERVRHVATVSDTDAADRVEVEAALRSVTQLEAWCASRKARLAQLLSSRVSFPEKGIGDCTRGSIKDGLKTKERGDLLDKLPAFADALDDGAVTAGHVDAITNSTRNLTGEQRAELLDRVADLVDVASVASVAEFKDRLDREVKLVQREDAIDRLARQRRATSMRTWTDGEGLFCLSGMWDPVTGVRLAAKIAAEREAMFAEPVSEWCPTDPFAKQDHLTALATARLILGESTAVTTGRPEFTVVIDADQPNGAGGPSVDWGIPVEIPDRVFAELAGDADVHAVIVRNGSCSTLLANSTWDAAHDSPTAPNGERCAPSTAAAPCPAAQCTSTAASCITSSSGRTAD